MTLRRIPRHQRAEPQPALCSALLGGELAEAGIGRVAYPGVTSDGDLGHFVATFEALAAFDLSLVVKFGVQFGLWGGSVYFLGTEQHHERYLDDVAAKQELDGVTTWTTSPLNMDSTE